MALPTARHVIQLCAALGTIVTVGLMLYAAMPLDDGYVQETVADYLMLAAFMGFAASPYLFLYWSANWAMPQPPTARLRAAIALLLTLYGIATLADVVLASPESQGALVFVLLPFLQWLVFVILWALLYLWDRLVTR